MSLARKDPRPNPTEGFRFGKPTRVEKERPKFSSLSRGKRMQRNMKTKQQVREAVFAPYVLWLHGDGAVCVVCGTAVNVQGCHVGQGGTGKKHGTAADMIRMCGDGPDGRGCHAQHDGSFGFFSGWTRERKLGWDARQRANHWDAFSAYVGAVVERAIVDGNDVAALIACEEAIAAHRTRIRGAA